MSDSSPIEITRKEIETLEKEREGVYKRFSEIEYELAYRRKLIESWEMILQSDTLKANLLKQIAKDGIQ